MTIPPKQKSVDPNEDPVPIALQSPIPETSRVTVGRDEILAARIVIRDENREHDEILHRLCVEHNSVFDKAITKAIRDIIGERPALLIFVEPGSASVGIGMTPTARHCYGLRRIADAVLKAVHEVINDKLNRQIPLALFIETLYHDIVAVGKNARKNDVVNAVLTVWGNVLTDTKTRFSKWLEGVREQWGWTWR